MPATDEQLMLAYAGGDAAAFEALYSRHKGPLFRFVLRSVKAQAQAEELFQEVWMRAIEARARYRPEAKFSTWLYTIAHNRMVDHWRSRGLVVVSSSDDEDSDMTSHTKLGTLENVHFYDVWGVRIFNKEVMAGRL